MQGYREYKELRSGLRMELKKGEMTVENLVRDAEIIKQTMKYIKETHKLR